jgi:hypothetical protein
VPICGSPPKSSYCPDGKCLVDETRKAIATLQDRAATPVQQLQALEEVVHFVGDLHQPLHAANNDDRGGNTVQVIVGGHLSNLHHVWDTEALENAVGTDEAAAEDKVRLSIPAADDAGQGNLDSWLAQSHELAVAYVYKALAQPAQCGRPTPDQAISQAYLDGAAPIIRAQLGRAAVRLAVVLNAALK